MRRHYRLLTSVLCALGAAILSIAAKPPIAPDGTSLDLQIAARAALFPPRASAQSPVAVIALDRRSVDSPELAHYPRMFLAPIWATALTAVMDAGAKAAGFDEIFAFDANTFPGITANFDQPFLATLHKYRDRTVLARSATTLPARPFAFSVGYDALGLVEIPRDPDGHFRRIPASIGTSDGSQPTLSALLLRDASLTMPAQVLLAPRHHLGSIPTYALIDVLHCAQGDQDALSAAFGGKIVLFGGTLREEDQKQTSGRFLSPQPLDPTVAPCGLRRIAAFDPSSEAVPGVFLHAAAVAEVANGDLTATASPIVVAGVAALASALSAAAGLLLAPWTAAAAIAAIAAALLGSTIIALQEDYWIPLSIPLIAMAAGPAVAYTARYLVEERARRRIQRAFGRYLAPAIVQRLADDPAALRLGGERREVTIVFADLSGFTQMSGRLEPEVLTAAVNRYLGYVVEEVEKTGGYIDKFMGDGVMAMWGAPAADPHHAVNAVRAAIAASVRIRRQRAQDEALGAEGFSLKVGVNSGPAVVGNVGTEQRCNYTAIGETVNLASRLEGVPAVYRCTVVIGPRTAELVGGDFLLRELDWVLVKGGKAPMAIYEPIAALADASREQVARATRFAEALATFRAGRFNDAAAIWAELAGDESIAAGAGNGSPDAVGGPPAMMARRASELAANPPQGWDGVHVLALK